MLCRYVIAGKKQRLAAVTRCSKTMCRRRWPFLLDFVRFASKVLERSKSRSQKDRSAGFFDSVSNFLSALTGRLLRFLFNRLLPSSF